MPHCRPEKSIETLVFWSKKYGDCNKFILSNNNLCIFQVRLNSCYLSVEIIKNMRSQSPGQTPQSSFFDITSQLNQSHPLIALCCELDWQHLEQVLKSHYSDKGRPVKPIRLMGGLLILKQLYNLSDEAIVEQWQMNPYFQFFCGQTSFQTTPPCHVTELVKFRNRIGKKGVAQIFGLSVKLHGRMSEETKVLVDTTVQEKSFWKTFSRKPSWMRVSITDDMHKRPSPVPLISN